MKIAIMTAVALLLNAGATTAQSARYHAHLVASDADPCVRVHLDPAFTFLGRVEGAVMNGTGHAERFVFGDVVQGELRRAAIVHFEHFLPDNARTFEYPRFRMDTLAGVEYLHQIWPQPQNQIFATAPLDSLLKAHGILAQPDWLLNRWARVVSADRKHELLLFYLESGATLGADISKLAAQWQPQGIAQPMYQQLEAEFIKRARAAVHVESCPAQ